MWERAWEREKNVKQTETVFAKLFQTIEISVAAQRRFKADKET